MLRVWLLLEWLLTRRGVSQEDSSSEPWVHTGVFGPGMGGGAGGWRPLLPMTRFLGPTPMDCN